MPKKMLLSVCVSVLLVMSVFVTTLGAGVSAEDESFLSGGSVAEEYAVEIEDWHDLDAVREDLDDDYVLMNDLDEDTDGYEELVDTEKGWEPIGDNDNEFTGAFDGNSHEISDFYIDRPDTYIGLFGGVGYAGEVHNMGVVDAEVSGVSSVGGLVGVNDGTVENSYVTGNVHGVNGTDFLILNVGGLVGVNFGGTVENSYATSNVSGDRFVGGLVGRNDGLVKNSYATGNVSAVARLGGLVGGNRDGGTVENSYALGDVSGEYGEGGFVVHGFVVAGLVGVNSDGTVENSYATGNVSGERYVAGLVGVNSDGTVENSYATGNVSGDENVAGLVGVNSDGTVENSFWNTETSGTEESYGGTGKTTAEMKDVATYTNTETEGLEEPWNFAGDPYDDEGDDDIWGIDEDEEINDGYPFLSWKVEEPEEYNLTFIVEGNEGDPIEEATIEVDGMEQTTNSDGEAVFEELEPDTYDWEVTLEDYETEEGEVEIEDQDETLTVTMEEEVMTYDLFFEVEDEDGNAIEGATIEVDGMEETTNSDGEAVFEELEPDTYDWEVTLEDYETEEGEVEIEDQDETLTVTMEEDEDTSGFTSMILILGIIIAVAIYQKKKQ